MRIRLLSWVEGFALGLVTVFASSSGVAQEGLHATAIEATDVQSLPKTRAGEISVIVKLDAAPLATYQGDVTGLQATDPRATGERRLDVRSPRARAYRSYLEGKENRFEQAVSERIPRAKIVHRFRSIIGGVSVVLPADRVKELLDMPEVVAVYPDVLLPLNTERSPEFIGAPALWNAVGGQANAGEGVIVGILDSGIWPEHPSVADEGHPPPPAKWTGTACEFGSAKPGDAMFACQNKLIGANRMMTTFDTFGRPGGLPPLAGEFLTARDNNGHGSHTATTAVGNAGVLASTGATLSGVAPRAHLAVYKVCFTAANGTGSCYTSDSAAAIEQAIADGVDVLNFSVGGGTNPYADAVSLAFLDAYAAGIFVAASAGNDGPAANTVGHREPWVTTVAATTTDKSLLGHADLTKDGGSALSVTGASATDGAGPASVVLASVFSDGVTGGGATCPGIAEGEAEALCCNAFPEGTFAGKIAVCKRGTNARAEKSANVKAGGASGMILYNPTANTLNADLHSVPSLHIDHVHGASLISFLTGAANPLASLLRDDLPGRGDVTASFSSRGSANQTLGISKPDVAAPGVDILAANAERLAVPIFAGQRDLFQIISGTSMASPHVAGAGALLRQLHPDWTPGQIKSALMMTASNESTVKEDAVTPASPFDVGSGRIDLTRAGNPGLTISETAENYVLLEGNLSTSNYPSLYIPVLAGKATVQRKLKSVDSLDRDWKIQVVAPNDLKIVTNSSIELRAGSEKTLTIFVDASQVPLGQSRHAALFLTSRAKRGGDIELTFPITVVRRQGAVTLNKACTPLTLAVKASTTCTVQFTNTTFEDQTATVLDLVPDELRVRSVTGASRLGNLVFFHGTVRAAEPPVVNVEDGAAPFGYLPLRLLGVAKQSGFGDETIGNFGVPAGASFLYAGQSYTTVGVTSNGYAIVGGGTAADVQFLNQQLPNSAVPNNVLAPFWTDLNLATIPAASPAGLRVATLTASTGARWFVVDFEQVPNFGQPAQVNSFQVWIGLNGVQDITFTYGVTTTGADGLLTVGAENLFGNRGENYYVNGTGALPTPTTVVRVTGATGAPGETKTITIGAEGRRTGKWTNCADMLTDTVFGIATSCVEGTVTR